MTKSLIIDRVMWISPIPSVEALAVALLYVAIAPSLFAWWHGRGLAWGAAIGLGALAVAVVLMAITKVWQIPVLGVVGVAV